MSAIHSTSPMHPIGVLLGGSGRAPVPAKHGPVLAALLRPHPLEFAPCGAVTELRAS
jgi:hypothetical protein